MQKLFDELQSLDERCYISYKLSEDILMEHAANGINVFIRWKFDKNSKIIIACGSGNNGADGLALARLLHKDYDVEIFYVNEQKSPMAILQIDRAHAIGVHSTFELNKCDVLVDALYGTGFKGNFNYEAKAVMQTINKLDAYKIACDIPSGLRQDGTCDKDTFRADITLTMGALKKSMFSEQAKERVGRIEVLDLGVPRSVYEAHTNWNLLDMDDLRLPHRVSKNSHKGTFGHLVIPCGEKSGAAIISGLSALKFGSGLVSLLSNTPTPHIPYSLMHTTLLPHNTSAIACGMGIGDTYTDEELLSFFDNTLPVIADADLLHKPVILELLQKEDLIVTPHPKEFISLLKLTQIADIDVETLQNDRFKYCEEFSKKYPKVTLLLKGANVIIAKGDEYFINAYGTSALAKGGSGDV
ncbi:MAG: NAD(P)H-hydrate epimerase, partial [Sulfurimonas sp.]|nr:NAD(P)H-hydrate epimerase [Sulfurimonas sp.]